MGSEGFRDYFQILGLERTADQSEIKQAFRRLARKYHPDVNSGNKKAESKFKEINEAYEVLSDDDKRSKYEQFGKYWNQGAMSGGSGFDTHYRNFDDFINDLLGKFGGGQVGEDFSKNVSRKPIALDAEINVTISFLEAFRGIEKILLINNERVQVKIPEGIKPGSRLRVKGKGNIQPGKGRRGDLYLNIAVKPHSTWRLEGDILRSDLSVTFDEIALGAKIQISLPDGEAQVIIPSGTMPGKNLRLKGKGWPLKTGRGDLILTLKMELPSNWSLQELDLIQQLREIRSFHPRKD